MDFVPFPSFSKEHLSIWFAQMESAFTLNGIVEESDKFDYLLIYVPSDSLKVVEDIVLNPPSNDKYGHIKFEMIKRMTIKRMMEVEFGNETPSEYLRKLKDIAGQRVTNEEILNVWLNNLPEKVRELVSLGTGSIDRLCEMADKAIVLLNPTPKDTSSTQPKLNQEISHNEWCEMMKYRMEALAKKLVKHMGNKESEDDGKKHSLSLENILKLQTEEFNVLNWNWNASSSSKTVCWYHTNFGDKAIACVAPCEYK